MILSWPILTTVIGLAAVIWHTKFRLGSLLSPLSLTLLMLVAIFGVRPILLFADADYYFYGQDIAVGFQEATIIGFLGVASLAAGAIAGRVFGKRDYRRRRRIGDSLGDRTTLSLLLSLALVVAWFVGMIFLGGRSFIFQLFEGRSAETSAEIAGVPALFSALSLLATVIAVATKLQRERIRPLALSQGILFWVVVCVSLVPPLALGNRRFLVPIMIALLIGLAWRSWNRFVNPVWLFLGGAAVVVLSVVPFVRSAGSRTGSTNLGGAMVEYFEENGLAGTLRPLFVSYDTEMFDHVAFFAPRMGTDIPWGLGRGTVLEFVQAVLPAAWLEGFKRSNAMLEQGFGASCTTGICPVPSLVGYLYYDFTVIGLVGLSILLGYFFVVVEFRASAGLLRNPAYILFISMIPVLVRGNPSSHAALILHCVVVIALLSWVVRWTPSLRTGDDAGRRAIRAT